MAKKINTSQVMPLAVGTTYAALNTSFWIEAAGNASLEQWYDPAGPTYKPDRAGASPLTLRPVLSVDDPDGIVAARVTAFTSVVWEEIVEENGVVTNNGNVNDNTETVIIGGQGFPVYQVNSDFSLIVRRNVPPTKKITIRAKAGFTDPRTGEATTYQGEKLLTTQKVEEPPYQLLLTTPRRLTYHPLLVKEGAADGTQLRNTVAQDGSLVVPTATFGVKLLYGKDVVTTATYFWYWQDADHPDGVLFGDAATPHPAYVGQAVDPDTHEATLTLNPDATEGLTVMVKAAPTAGALAPTTGVVEHFTLHVADDDVTAEVFSPNGKSLRGTMGEMRFGAFVRVNAHDMHEAVRSEYVRLQWKRKRASVLTAPAAIAWGDQVTVPRAQLTTTAGDSMIVYPELQVLGPYEYVTDADGNPVTTDGGELIIGRQ